MHGQGFELVIVTTSAAQRHAHENQRGGVDHVVELIEAIFLRVGRLVVPRAQPREAQADQRVGVGVRQLVAGKLLQKKAVVRLVVVERLDDVIAVAPHARLGRVALIAGGLGIAHHVEPVPGPAFAVRRTS